jgi:hypothetical protein
MTTTDSSAYALQSAFSTSTVEQEQVKIRELLKGSEVWDETLTKQRMVAELILRLEDARQENQTLKDTRDSALRDLLQSTRENRELDDTNMKLRQELAEVREAVLAAYEVTHGHAPVIVKGLTTRQIAQQVANSVRGERANLAAVLEQGPAEKFTLGDWAARTVAALHAAWGRAEDLDTRLGQELGKQAQMAEIAENQQTSEAPGDLREFVRCLTGGKAAAVHELAGWDGEPLTVDGTAADDVPTDLLEWAKLRASRDAVTAQLKMEALNTARALAGAGEPQAVGTLERSYRRIAAMLGIDDVAPVGDGE